MVQHDDGKAGSDSTLDVKVGNTQLVPTANLCARAPAPYPDCANQTLSPEEKAELIRIRSRKVWRMKTRVKQLIRKAKDK